MRKTQTHIKKTGNSFTLFKKFRKTHLIIDFLIILFAVVVLHFHFSEEIISRIRRVIISADVMIYNTAGRAREITSNFRYFFSENIDKLIFDLKSENIRLSNENQKLKYLESENRELRKLLELKKNDDYKIIFGKVVTVFSNDYMRSCVIDAGSSKGVKNNDIVRNQDGLIGRVIETSENWCRVLLIIDPNSNVPAKIGERGVNAIISGNNSRKLYISMIHEDTSVYENDIVETSSYGENFCEKVPIGTVIKKNDEFFIVPFADFNNLNYVEIISKKEK